MPPPEPTTAFALAKIQPPRLRTSLVERPALEAALGAALRQQPLTLLVAPAGSGKTAALTRQIRLLPAGTALAWVSADADDALQRFLACLTTALAPQGLPWQVAPEALGTLALAQRGLRAVADVLVNALAAAPAARGLLVVDDAHRITDPQVFQLLQMLVERLPAHWGLAIASRVDPPLSLARWRASGDLAEFRQADLRFSAGETDALARSLGLAAAAPVQTQVQALRQQTDGWAAGLRLSLSSLALNSGSGNGGGSGAGSSSRPGAGLPAQRHLFDYLASEVLDDMPDDLRQFLLRCAVLPELTAARCAHVSGQPDAARLLAEVERRGLFVASLDADEPTLRLHDLFREFLQNRLQRDQPQALPDLLRRAADHETDLARAVGHLVRAADWDRAADLLAAHGPALVHRGGAPTAVHLLDQLPPAALAARPALRAVQGLAAFSRFDFDTMAAAMAAAADGMDSAGDAPAATLARAFASLARQNTGALDRAAQDLAALAGAPMDDATRAFVAFCSAWAAYAQQRAHDVAPHLATMLDALARCDDLLAWDRCFFLSLLAGLPGTSVLLARFADGALQRAGDAPSQLRAGAFHIRTWLAFGQGDVAAARQWLARADHDCQWLGRPRSVMTESWMAHTLIDAAHGDRAAALAAAEENKQDLEQRSLPSNRQTHEYEELFTFVRAAWLLGDDPLLRRLQAQLDRTGHAFEWAAADDDRRFGRAMRAWCDGDLTAAEALLDGLDHPEERSCFFPSAQARVMRAALQVLRGAPAEAAATLRPWLQAALHCGDVGGALLAGRRALQPLAAADWGALDALDAVDASGRGSAGLPTGGAALLRRLADSMPAGPGATRPGPAATEDHAALAALSEREREVLACIAAGQSNKHIARALDLSPHTVKRHVANILDKLGAQTRLQAAGHWRGDPP